MVQVEVVRDSGEPTYAQEPKITEESDYSDGENFDAEEDDFDINESLTDRIVALKDVVPPKYRDSIATSFGSAASTFRSVFGLGGKALWVVSSSTLLLGVPLSLCILSEQQLSEMEKGMGITDSNDVLAGGGGAEQGFAATPSA